MDAKIWAQGPLVRVPAINSERGKEGGKGEGWAGRRNSREGRRNERKEERRREGRKIVPPRSRLV